MDEMTLTLNSPITEEQWDMIEDVDFDHTDSITFYTKHGKEVEFVKRKTGKWMEKDVFRIDDELDDSNVIDAWQSAKCSVCGKYHTTPYLYSFDNFNYCPNCGSAMTEGEQP